MPDPIYVYATEADLKQFGMAGLDRMKTVGREQIDASLVAASSLADGYLTDGNGYPFTLPLIAPAPPALTMHVAWIAAYLLMSDVGYSPEPGQPEVYRERYEDALKWLERVRDGAVIIGEVVDSTPPDAIQASAVPFVISGTSRGYSGRGESRGGGPEVVFDVGRGRNGGWGGGFVGD